MSDPLATTAATPAKMVITGDVRLVAAMFGMRAEDVPLVEQPTPAPKPVPHQVTRQRMREALLSQIRTDGDTQFPHAPRSERRKIAARIFEEASK